MAPRARRSRTYPMVAMRYGGSGKLQACRQDLKEDAVPKTRFINPEALNKPPAYTQVVEVSGPCRTVYISGQLGSGPDGSVSGNFRAQAEQVYKNLSAALTAVGATFKDVVKV